MESPLEPFASSGPPEPPAAAPRRVPGHPAAFFATLALLYLLPGAASQLASPAVGLAWTQIFVFLVPTVLFASASNLVPARVLRLGRPPPRTLELAVAIGTVGFVAAGATMAIVSAALPRAWVRAFDLTPLFHGPRAERWALAAIATAVAPACEEIAFRGHLLTTLGARLRPPAAIAVTAFLFAVLHLDPVRFVAVLELGLVFGWLSWRAGSIWPAVAAHAANNAVATILVSTADPSAHAADPQPLASLVALAVGVAILWPLVAAYRRLTPHPPPLEEALVPAEPGDPDVRLRLRRVPAWQRRVVGAGAVLLLLLGIARRMLRA